MDGNQLILLMTFVFGIYFGRKAPLSKNRMRQWIYHRRGIPYYKCHILDGNKIIHYEVIKQNAPNYNYDGKEYLMTSKEGDVQITPYIQYGGDMLVFHSKDNLNPLKFSSEKIEPLYNDPSIIASMIANKDIKDSTSSDYPQVVTAIKRAQLIYSLLTVLLTALAVWFITGGGTG